MGAGVKWGRPDFSRPILFAASPGFRVLGLRYALAPPEARPSRRMARGVPKGPNRRFDRRS